MNTLKLATMAYVSTFQKLLGQTTRTAHAAREIFADRLVAAAFEALEETHSVNDSPVAASYLDLALGAGRKWSTS
jgi:hypothetical protein